MKEARSGDIIHALGIHAVIEKILYQDYWERTGWDIEFIDSKGNYHHWKQSFDGGSLERKPEKLNDCYGIDCSDVFQKYGYNV